MQINLSVINILFAVLDEVNDSAQNVINNRKSVSFRSYKLNDGSG